MRSPVLFLLLACASALAQSTAVPFPTGREQTRPARSVVSSYCRLDYQGSRLDKEGWPPMKALTTWRENPEFLGFTVVSQYDVKSADQGLRGATVKVQYAVLGQFQPGIGFHAEPRSETVVFQLKQVDGAWHIEDLDPAINPHVSKPRAIAWMKVSLISEKDPASKLALEMALKDLGATSR